MINNNTNIQGMHQRPSLNFNLSDTQPMHCENCNHGIFQQGIIFRKVSKLIAGTDKDALVPINVPYCVKCKTPVSELLPPDIRDQYTETKIEL